MRSIIIKTLPIIAVITSCFLNIPQIYTVCVTKNVASFDIRTMIMRMIVTFCWTSYGYLIQDYILSGSALISFISETLLISMKIWYRTAQRSTTLQNTTLRSTA